MTLTEPTPVPTRPTDTWRFVPRSHDLRGNMGTQFYDVPAAVEIGSSPWTVLVWCQTFAVPIANATPA